MIRVRAFAAGDEEAFRLLYLDCLAHYGIAPPPDQTIVRLLDDLAAGRHMSCHIGWIDDRPAGFATWNLAFPAGDGMSLVMKELFVSATARGTGLGRALLAALAEEAEAAGCTRLDWATDGGNTGSQAFYAGLGLTPTGKVSYRVDRADLADFARKIAPDRH